MVDDADQGRYDADQGRDDADQGRDDADAAADRDDADAMGGWDGLGRCFGFAEGWRWTWCAPFGSLNLCSIIIIPQNRRACYRKMGDFSNL
jgi:hypothetical protein